MISVVTFSGTAWPETTPAGGDTAAQADTAKEKDGTRYYLATLPSTNRKRVDAMCLKFLSLVPKAMLVPRTEENTVYRLVADTYNSMEATRKRRAELQRYCESPFVVKNGDVYEVIAGSQLNEILAEEERERLAARNIRTNIKKLTLPLKKWQMRSKESFTVREAVIMASRLAGIGVITTLEQSATMPLKAVVHETHEIH